MTNWPTLPVRRLFSVINGGTPASDAVNWGGDVPWATPVDLASVNGGTLTATQRTLTKEGLRNGSSTVPPGSLVLSTRAPIGYVAEASVRTAFNQGCRGLVPAVPGILRYFRYQFSSLADRLTAQGQGSTFIELSSDALAGFPLVVPPLPTQRAIADYLDRETGRIDAVIAAKRRVVYLLDERWQVVLQNAASGCLLPSQPGRRRPTAIPWLTTVPAHWREGLLKHVAKLGTGHTPSRSHPEWWVDPRVPWITTGEVAQMRTDGIEYIIDTRERISELGIANSSAEIHSAGTVVLCRTASAGYSAIMARDMATSQDFATWTCGPLLRPRYLLFCLRAMRQDLLGRLAMGSTHKTIYMPDIESIKIPIPPVADQDSLVAAAYEQHAKLDATRSSINAQLLLLQERRRALITAAVTGHLDMPEAA